MATVRLIERMRLRRAGEARERTSSLCGDSRGDRTADVTSRKHRYVSALTFLYYFTYRTHRGIKWHYVMAVCL